MRRQELQDVQAVVVGLERILSDQIGLLKGKRVGLGPRRPDDEVRDREQGQQRDRQAEPPRVPPRFLLGHRSHREEGPGELLLPEHVQDAAIRAIRSCRTKTLHLTS